GAGAAVTPLPHVTDEHSAAAAPQRQSRAESRRTTANDDDVPEFPAPQIGVSKEWAARGQKKPRWIAGPEPHLVILTGSIAVSSGRAQYESRWPNLVP
ncbi:MAG TPA: hypothetical protein VFO36_07970, partial [Nitrospiraceae bacterium]|nr:hypothetical protein [Nitrospiraceae bacterium]